MKKINIVIAVALVALCLVGWLSVVSSRASKGSEYKTYISQADEWMDAGLYQRAIASYEKAFAEKPSEGVYEKMLAAYKARYEEAPEDTVKAYEGFLKKATAAYPKNVDFVRPLAKMYMNMESYTKAFTCLRAAVDNGIEDPDIIQMYREARYAFTVRGADFEAILPQSGAEYTVFRRGMWGTYNAETGSAIPYEYVYVGPVSEDGAVVLTNEKDSRLIDGENVVLGIFSKKVVEAGFWSEGLVAANTGKDFGYYNEFAELQFGGFTQAGTFQNGKAAVEKGGKWMLIDASGEETGEHYAEIVLNERGEYLSDGVILAAEKAGKYKIYDSKWKEKASLDCEKTDICTADGLIAVCKNGKWGFVNTDGEVVIKYQYEQARSFSNGLAAVCVDGLWGFIDRHNNLVIPCQFAEARYFDSQGCCAVCLDEVEQKLDDEGNPVDTWKIIKLKNGIVED